LFLFKKLVTPFLLPPGLFVAILILLGVWRISRKHVKSGLSLLGMGLLMWSLSIGPVADLFIRPLNSSYPLPGKPQGDVIILLCGGAHHDVKDFSGMGRPSSGTLERMTDAVRLHRKLQIPIVVSGGRVFDRKQSEAAIVKRFLLDIGVHGSEVWVEGKSRDTFENAFYSQQLCREKGYSRPILVTSAHHLKRAVWSFQRVGLNVMPYPTGGTRQTEATYAWHDYLPRSFRTVRSALHEYLGLAYYRIRHSAS